MSSKIKTGPKNEEGIKNDYGPINKKLPQKWRWSQNSRQKSMTTPKIKMAHKR